MGQLSRTGTSPIRNTSSLGRMSRSSSMASFLLAALRYEILTLWVVGRLSQFLSPPLASLPCVPSETAGANPIGDSKFRASVSFLLTGFCPPQSSPSPFLYRFSYFQPDTYRPPG